MKTKICGMRNPQNISEIAELKPDYLGFIFYEKSPRFVSEFSVGSFQFSDIKKVGVFVNESIEKMRETAEKYNLDVLQLHGSETPLQCLQLQSVETRRATSLQVIKAFSIAEKEDFEQTENYENCADFFLFDTKTSQYGGSGKKFDWEILTAYKGETPFFLSGGISPEDAEKIKAIRHSKFYGIDINSRFEIEPGLKNVEKVREFIIEIKL